MIAEKLLELPERLKFDGVEFQLNLFKNGSKDIRIGYHIINDDIEWQHPYENKVNFLVQYEKQETDEDLLFAIEGIKQYLANLDYS